MINEFVSMLSKRGFSSPTRYKVDLTNIPERMLKFNGISEIQRDLSFFAESAEFPGTQILTQELRIYDMPAKFAYGKAHDELNITFRLDSDFQVKKFFDLWVNSIYNKDTGDVFYKKEYAGIMRITQMTSNGNSCYTTEIIDCFPTSIGQVSLGWDQQGSYNRIPITFSFKKIKVVANENIMKTSSSNVSQNTFLPKTNNVDILSQADGQVFRKINTPFQIGLLQDTNNIFNEF